VTGFCEQLPQNSATIKCKDFERQCVESFCTLKSFKLLAGWFVGWLVSWLVGWLVDWLVGWLVG
jgi:hypothetical protein